MLVDVYGGSGGQYDAVVLMNGYGGACLLSNAMKPRIEWNDRKSFVFVVIVILFSNIG